MPGHRDAAIMHAAIVGWIQCVSLAYNDIMIIALSSQPLGGHRPQRLGTHYPCRRQVQRLVIPDGSSCRVAGRTTVYQPAGGRRRDGCRRAEQTHRHACHPLYCVRRIIDSGTGNHGSQEERSPVRHRNRCREKPNRGLVACRSGQTRQTRR